MLKAISNKTMAKKDRAQQPSCGSLNKTCATQAVQKWFSNDILNLNLLPEWTLFTYANKAEFKLLRTF